VEVVAPQDWWTLSQPEVTYAAGVTIGDDIRLLGFDAPMLEAYPGQDIELELLWQALVASPEAGLVVVQLHDDTGRMLMESVSVPAEGRAPFAQLGDGQVIRDRQRVTLPGQLEAGVYDLEVGRRRPDTGWLPVRRKPFDLGARYPLATVRVLGRTVELNSPTVQTPVDARFGDHLRLLGYNLESGANQLALSVLWQVLSPTEARTKMFVHLVGPDGGGDIRAQADVYPRLPTTSWLPGEYLSEEVTLDLPRDLPVGEYALLIGWYDEYTGDRLPVLDAADRPLGESLLLGQLELGK
jgi:hypothetical protein